MPDPYENFVEHPRFGRGPRITGLNPRGLGLLAKFFYGRAPYFHWHSPPECRIPNTAILADPTKQASSPVAVTHYFDVSRRCRDCGRMFLFFAEEQRYWYETLGFVLDADCVRCVDCRRSERHIAEQRRTYEELLARSIRTDDETLKLIECGLSLIEQSIFGMRSLQGVRALLNSFSSDSVVRESAGYQSLRERADRLTKTDPSDRPPEYSQ